MSKEKKLTIKEEMFVKYYVELHNATEAAVKAGYSEKTARQIGAINLTKVYIQTAIQKEKQPLLDSQDLNAERVLSKIKKVASVCTQEQAIKGFKTNELGETVQFDKYIRDSKGANDALTNLAKHFKLLTDKIESDNKNENMNITAKVNFIVKKKE